jgi:hypothetical protein
LKKKKDDPRLIKEKHDYKLIKERGPTLGKEED